MFASPSTLIIGLITGLVFGFFLRKGHVSRFEVIANQFLLRDFTVLKIMLTAVAVGSIGIYAFLHLGYLDSLFIKEAAVWGNLIGGAIFGIGMATLGYCPGTGVAALGDGARDAIPGVIGMVVGASIYAHSYPFLSKTILSKCNLGKVTLPSLFNISPGYIVLGFSLFCLIFFYLLERHEKSKRA